MDTFDSGLESGKWAIRFLLASLMMTPLNTYFGWKRALRLRKSSGLWAFGFAFAHVLFYIREAKLDWLTVHMPFYFTLGLAGSIILSLLAVTSNRWAMQYLGRNWKRLHRLVYVSATAVVIHSLLATTMSKKVLARDPQAVSELKVYVAILAVLLVVRIPLVRRLLKQIPVVLRRHHKPDPQIDTVPMVHGRESGSSVRPTFVILNKISNPPAWSRAGIQYQQYQQSREPSNGQEDGREAQPEQDLQPAEPTVNRLALPELDARKASAQTGSARLL